MTAFKTLAIGVVMGLSSGSTASADSLTSAEWIYHGGHAAYRVANPMTTAAFGPNAARFATTPVPAAPPVSVAVASVTAADHTSNIPSLTATTNIPASSPQTTADAYINLGTSTPPEASSLTTGGAQPWYDSPAVEKVYGGSAPNSSQQASFSAMVLNDVKQTYNEAGLNPSLTLDPGTHANHTLSVVSNTGYGPNPNAIGITDVGHNGFSFIDKLNYATTPQELATVLSKNISHELMHAFGVAIHPDSSGNYIDTGTASWALLSNPNSTFSPAAVALIKQTGYGNSSNGSSGAQMIDGEQNIAPVPEPTTIAVWSLGGLVGLVVRRRKTSKTA